MRNWFWVLIILFLGLTICGCATEYNLATGREEMILISSEREVAIGRSIANQIEQKFKVLKDESLEERIDRIGQGLAEKCDRKDIVYHFKILDEEEVNAVSLPGGFIYINKGLIERIDKDDELACVIGHEMGHIAARHAMKRLQGSLGYSILRILISTSADTRELGRGADMAFNQLLLAYSKEDELLADRLGVRYAARAGYDPTAMLTFLEKLKELERKRPIQPKRHFRTHPYIPQRIRVVKEEVLGRIDFDDYINKDEVNP
jgi:predicted Zn-dependent protease